MHGQQIIKNCYYCLLVSYVIVLIINEAHARWTTYNTESDYNNIV